MKLRIILLHDSCKNCRKSISAKNIKDWLELISAPTISPRGIQHRHFGTVEISACVPFGPRDILIWLFGHFGMGIFPAFSTIRKSITKICYCLRLYGSLTVLSHVLSADKLTQELIIPVITNKGKHCWPLRFSMETQESFSTRIFWQCEPSPPEDVTVQKYFRTMDMVM